MSYITKQWYIINIGSVLLFLIGFFATWGEGMQHIFTKSSLIYPALIAIYLVYNFNTFKCTISRHQIVPREFKTLYVFITIHTVLYLILNFQSIGFGTEVGEVNDAGFVFGQTESGIIIVRYFLFLLFSLYLTVDLNKNNKLKIFSYAYISGFIFTILGGAYNSYANGLMRFSGGLQDPNGMAFDAIVALLLSIYLHKINTSKKVRGFIIFSIAIDLFAVFLSFSRGAYLALFIWFILCSIHIGLTRNVMRMIFVLILFAIIGTNVINKIGIDIETISTRFSIEEARKNKGANRGYIWETYLTNADKYFLTGMGIGNSPKIMRNNKQGVSENYESHNLYIQFFAEFGFIGLFLYLRYWKKYIKEFRRTDGSEFILMSIGICMMIVTFFLNIDKGRTFWIVLSILNMIWIRNRQQNIRRANCA